jgi:hypothetical protein
MLVIPRTLKYKTTQNQGPILIWSNGDGKHHFIALRPSKQPAPVNAIDGAADLLALAELSFRRQRLNEVATVAFVAFESHNASRDGRRLQWTNCLLALSTGRRLS